MYTTKNFKSKKALKEAVQVGERVTYYQPFGGGHRENGVIYLEGPHYPEPHRWYAQCVAENGIIVRVK